MSNTHHTASGIINKSTDSDFIDSQFSEMLAERGIKGVSKAEMLSLPLEKKRILLNNHLTEKKKRKSTFWSQVKQTIIPSSNSGIAANLLTRKQGNVENSQSNLNHSAISSSSSSDIRSTGFYGASKKLSIASSAASYSSAGDTHSFKTHNDRVLKTSERRDSIGYPQSSSLWFILQISNRNTSMKSLQRHLTHLRATILSGGPVFIRELVSSIVPHLGSDGISGIAALEIALDRVCAPYLQRREAKKKSIIVGAGIKIPSRQSSITMRYADQISPDAIRLQVMKCVELIMLTDYGMNFIHLSTGLIRQIIWCYSRNPTLSTEDQEFDLKGYRTYLKLVSLISRIVGPACFLDDGLKNTVVTVMGELQRHYNDPYPFYHLVLSLKSPDGGARKASLGTPRSSILGVEALVDMATDVLEVEQEEWDYRTQTMVLLNGIISSGKSISKRMRMRKVFESSGLRNILRFLLDQNPSTEFKTQANLYFQDRDLDLKENEKEYKEKNAADQTRFIQSIETLYQSIQKLPDPDMISHFVSSTISSIDQIVKRLEAERGPLGSNENLNSMREDIGLVLSVVERTTRSLATATKQEKNDLKSDPDSIPTTKLSILETVQTEFYDAAKDVWGDPPSTVAYKSGKIGAIIEELDSTKQKYSDIIKEKEDLKKEIDFLRLSLYNMNAAAGNVVSDHPSFGDSSKSVIFNGFYTFGDGDQKVKMSAFQMWEEIQRLQGSINILEEKNGQLKEAHQSEKGPLVVGELSSLLTEEKSVNEKDVVPSAPPPPPGPPPPPDAPSPLMRLMQDPQSNIILKSKQPMKPLQWEKLAFHTVSSTIWNSLFKKAYLDQQQGDIVILQENLLDPDFIDLFSKAPKSKIAHEENDQNLNEIFAKDLPPKEIIRFIETRQGQNIEILLNSFKMSYSHIKDAILNIDDQILNLDRITRILGLLPSLDVIAQITSYDGPSSDLGIPEQFLLTLTAIPRFYDRLECMSFRHLFYQEYVEIDPDIKTVILACQQTRTSSKFASVLRVILVIGNYLNGTSFRGNARGFKLSALLNVRDTKSNSSAGKAYSNEFCKGSTTLLHFIVRILEKVYPESLDFISNELTSVGPASKISIPSLINGVNDLSKGFDRMKQEVEVASKTINPQDKFISLFSNFTRQTAVKILDLEENIRVLQREMNDLFTLFAEDDYEKQDEPQQFFENITTFGIMIRKAKKENDLNDLKLKKALQISLSKSNTSLQSSFQDITAASSETSLSFTDDAMARGTFLAVITPAEDPQSVLKPGVQPFSKRLSVSLPSYDPDINSANSSQESEIRSNRVTNEEPKSIEEDTRALELTEFLMNSGTSLADARTILRGKKLAH